MLQRLPDFCQCRLQARQKAITAAGIDYLYDSLADTLPKKAKHTVFAES